jgi:hypothetical protein
MTLGESQGALIEGLGGESESKHKGIHEVLDHLEIKRSGGLGRELRDLRSGKRD